MRSSNLAFFTHEIQGQGEKHEDPAWGAYRVLYRTSQNMCPVPKETLLHRGRSTKLPREKGHMKSMPSDLRRFKSRCSRQVATLAPAWLSPPVSGAGGDCTGRLSP